MSAEPTIVDDLRGSATPVIDSPADSAESAKQSSAEDSSAEKSNSAAVNSLPTDTLKLGLAYLLAITVVQKLVGFVRNLLFCRWLEPFEIGYWELASSFFLLAAPLAVGGLPGSFGRYAEHFRQRGQLRAFLLRMTCVSFALAIAAVLVGVMCRQWLAWLLFENVALSTFAMGLCISLLAVIGYNYVVVVLEALRQSRAVTLLRFFHATLFSVIGVSLAWLWSASAVSIVAAYSLASVLTVIAALVVLIRLSGKAPADQAALDTRRMWSKMLPAAGWIWSVALVTNLFELVDRGMIVHFADLGAEQAAALVGQYHSSRALPMLLIGVVYSFSTMLMPYLSFDWEAGRRESARANLRFGVKCVAVGMTGASIAMLAIAPVLFDRLLQGNYQAGLDVLPWTLVYAAWFGILVTLQCYLWCVERAGWACGAIGVGLLVNVLFNLVLLPLWGLPGAVVATAIANLTAVVLLHGCNHLLGMRIDRTMIVATCLPLLIPCGAVAALWGLLLLAAIEWRWAVLFTRDEWLRMGTLVRSIGGKRRGEAADG